MQSLHMLVEQSLGLQFLLEPSTGSIIAASRGACGLLPTCQNRISDAGINFFGTNVYGSGGFSKDDPFSSDVQYMHQFLLRHTADTWQNAIEPLLRGDVELVTIPAYLVDPSATDEHTSFGTNFRRDKGRLNSCVCTGDRSVRTELTCIGEEVYIDVQLHCRCLLAIAHPTAKYWQNLVSSLIGSFTPRSKVTFENEATLVRSVAFRVILGHEGTGTVVTQPIMC